MSDILGAPAPDESGGGPSPGGPPQMGAGGANMPGGLLAALRQQQGGPDPSAPGAGNQANSLMLIKNGLDLFQQALAGLDHESPVYRDVLQSMQRVTRHLAQGAPTAGVQQTQLGDILRMVARSALMQRLQGQQRGGQGQGPQPPMPSTPLPGA